MGQQQKHTQKNEAGHQNDHQEHTHNHSTGIFTNQQLIKIKTFQKYQHLFGHHPHNHPHHHQHLEYRLPHKINTQIGLYSLKKLDAFNSKILSHNQKSLLNPAAPGLISYFLCTSPQIFLTLTSLALFKKYQFKALVRPPFILLVIGSAFAHLAINYTTNYFRQKQWSLARSNLVEKYKNIYGQKYLIEILNPNFRLPSA